MQIEHGWGPECVLPTFPPSPCPSLLPTFPPSSCPSHLPTFTLPFPMPLPPITFPPITQTSTPFLHTCRRIKGVRDDVIIKRVFNWTQNPGMAKQLALRKAELYDELLDGRQPVEMLEARPFLETLKKWVMHSFLAAEGWGSTEFAPLL